MKKICTFILCAFLAVGLFAACGGDDETINEDDSKNTTTNKFSNLFEGKFFEIGYPDGFEVKDGGIGLTLSKDEESIMVVYQRLEESKKGKVESVDDYISTLTTQLSDFSSETRDFGKHKGTWVEGQNDGKNGIMVMIPFDSWCAVAINNGSVDNETLELHREIISSLRITDENYNWKEVDISTDNDDEHDEVDNKDKEHDTDNDSNSSEINHEDIDADSTEHDDTAEKDAKFEISELEYGSSGMNLSDTFVGDFFTLETPSGVTSQNFNQGDSYMVSLMIDEFQVIISATMEHQELVQENTSGSINIEDGDYTYSQKIIKVDGILSNLIESMASDTMTVSCVISLPNWTINISGFYSGTSEEIKEKYDTIMQMIESFKITDPSFLN